LYCNSRIPKQRIAEVMVPQNVSNERERDRERGPTCHADREKGELRKLMVRAYLSACDFLEAAIFLTEIRFS
jgi:hypothetical protein